MEKFKHLIVFVVFSLFSIALISVATFWHISQVNFEIDTNFKNNNGQLIINQQPDSFNESEELSYLEYNYCKPDEDPDFQLSSEDERFYYYSGNKIIIGNIYQESPDKPVMFYVALGQACIFELTKKYDPDSLAEIKKDFQIDKAWENKPVCQDDFDSAPNLYGAYAVRIKGFKIPKPYIKQYSDYVHLSKYDSLLKSFYVDYEDIKEVYYQSEVECPIIL